MRYDNFLKGSENKWLLTYKKGKSKIIKFVWNGNNPLHEWEEEVVPTKEKPTFNHDSLVNWVFDERTFTPSVKLTNKGSYSIITDYLGTEAYDKDGKKVWEQELDIYGKAVNGGLFDEHFVPFRYQGQYSDKELDGTLYYNRFCYFDPSLGKYITQDPIGLDGENPTLYGYVVNQQLFPGIFKYVSPTKLSTFRGRAFEGTTWHHHPSVSELMQLVSRSHHRLQSSIFHPNGRGGRHSWGGGRRCR